jgi:hypothetical protein
MTMFLAQLFQRLGQGPQGLPHEHPARPQRRAGRTARPRRFLPQLLAFEDRALPSVTHAPLAHLSHAAALVGTAQHHVTLHEPLTHVSVAAAGVRHHGTIAHGPSADDAATHLIPFKVTGGGYAPEGILVVPGGTVPHTASGNATHVGNYTGTGMFTLLSLNPATGTGTFTGSYVMVAANGDRLAFKYGATTPGTFTIIPQSDGKVVVRFVAVFTPDPSQSTGRFTNVIGGGFTMIATTEPFVLSIDSSGHTPPFNYTWTGDGSLEVAEGTT